jgi:hypothetical protein
MARITHSKNRKTKPGRLLKEKALNLQIRENRDSPKIPG